MKSLILFTSSFPYGVKETYLENEIEYLSKAFNQVEIYPHYYNQGNKKQRIVPRNVKVHKAALPKSKHKRVWQAFMGIFKGAKLSLFFKEFFSKKVYLSKTHFKSWFFTLIDFSATIGSKQYNELRHNKNCILYFYWGMGWSLALLNFKNHNNYISFIRLHGGDTYLERANGYIPLRHKLFQKSKYLLPISNDLSKYITKTYKIRENKIFVSRLGVVLPKINSSKYYPKNKYLHIVSCSNVIKLKRIDIIVNALKAFDGLEIKWTHFGDGPELYNIKRLVKLLNFNTVQVQLMGRKTNQEVLKYYSDNDIDAFVNVSEHEGVPVSIMEAMAHRIPCIATDAGATRELVSNNNGILLAKHIAVDDLITSLKEVLDKPKWNTKRDIAHSTIKHNFEANSNYRKLCELLTTKK